MTTASALKNHFCPKKERWVEYDQRGFPLVTVCDTCIEEKLSNFPRNILENQSFDELHEKL
tara:strand:+ start:1335 stop:1517 length:183 start_codon:yes stop_codon:yes gene_type:complete